jgi:hypothetical protein
VTITIITTTTTTTIFQRKFLSYIWKNAVQNNIEYQDFTLQFLFQSNLEGPDGLYE